MDNVMNYTFDPKPGKAIDLPEMDSWPSAPHKFDEDSVWAVKAAIASRRPLLIRGEPGIGKSQLARAVARYLKLPFISYVVNERSEASDLLYRFDTVSRLAQAQLVSAVSDPAVREQSMDLVAEERFLAPGPLWWAFNWQAALDQRDVFFRNLTPPETPRGWKPAKGCVLLIDEIDKADTSVPNGLLEGLGNTGFQVPFGDCQTVRLEGSSCPPLVFITTNEERELPAAFLRRCLVLHIDFPVQKEQAMDFLLGRGLAHDKEKRVSEAARRKAAELLLNDRADALELGSAKPGAAEYLDLLRALAEIAPKGSEAQEQALDRIARFALRKNPPQEQI